MATYDIFISHLWRKNVEYDNLKKLLNNRTYMNFVYHEIPSYAPIDSKNEKYIKSVIGSEIRSCDLMLVPAHVAVTYSYFVIWEMDHALSKNIPIIGIKPYAYLYTSIEVQKRASRIVGWNTESIIKAIRELTWYKV